MKMFPDDNVWNVPVNNLPVNKHSQAWVNNMGGNGNLHPDFACALDQGKRIGIPLTIYKKHADVKEWKLFKFLYSPESDHVSYPIGAIEDGSDRHLIVYIEDENKLYELFNTNWEAGTADSGAVFDGNTNARRPWGWTSADAAGLPVGAGLVCYDDVAAGFIGHAIRFTANKTYGVDESLTASHWTSGPDGRLMTPTPEGFMQPGLGARFRLKADFDISGFDPFLLPILVAMKVYGIILADNGSDWYISGCPDERWNDDILAQLKKIKGRDFEVVDCRPLGLTKESYAAVGIAAQNEQSELPINAGSAGGVGNEVNDASEDFIEIKISAKVVLQIIGSHFDMKAKVDKLSRQIDELYKRYMV
jgi:hypothetical protein